MTTNDKTAKGKTAKGKTAKGRRGRPASVPKSEFIKAWKFAHNEYKGEHEGFSALAEALMERGSGHPDLSSAKNYASVRASALRKEGVRLPKFKRGLRKGQSITRIAPSKAALRARIAELESALNESEPAGE